MLKNIIYKRGQYFVKFEHKTKTYQSKGFATEAQAVAWRDTAKTNLANDLPLEASAKAPHRKTLGLRIAPHAHGWIAQHKEALEALAHANIDLTLHTVTLLKSVDNR